MKDIYENVIPVPMNKKSKECVGGGIVYRSMISLILYWIWICMYVYTAVPGKRSV